jgi:ATP-dependent DNA helicase RecG
MILLGKETSSHLLSPHVAQITWILKDESNNEISHEHIFMPLIFAAERVFGKLIRNLKYRYLQK